MATFPPAGTTLLESATSTGQAGAARRITVSVEIHAQDDAAAEIEIAAGDDVAGTTLPGMIKYCLSWWWYNAPPRKRWRMPRAF
jgi:hypothetical protein